MNKYILLLVSIFLISLTSANIVVTPQNQEVNTLIGKPTNFSINVFNNFTFEIFDFSFPELEEKGFVFESVTIPTNTSKAIDFVITTTESFYGSLDSKVQFKFMVDLPEEITTHQLVMSEYGLDENYIIIRKGDTIAWKNTDDISHKIYSPVFGEIVIPINGTSYYTFGQMGTFNYYDVNFNLFTGFSGTIEVVNRTSSQKAHNPNYDGILSLNLNSVSNPTNITVSNSQNTYNVDYNKFKKGLITITNVGTEVAEMVNISSNTNWIVFKGEGIININTNDNEWVEYTILPVITNTSQTNKTYNFDIKVKASNSNEESFNISVFIPYSEVSISLETDEDILHALEVFCTRYPTSAFCNRNTTILNQTEYGKGNILEANISSIDLYNILKDIKSIEDSQSRTDNEWKIFADKYGLTNEQMLNLVNQSLSNSLDAKDEQKERTITTWIITVTAVICLALIIIVSTYSKKKKKEDMLYGMHKYRR